MEQSTLPKTILRHECKRLFCSFSYTVEDRKPHIKETTDYKYKHMISVRLFWKTFSIIVKSNTVGIFFIDDEEQ